LDRADLALWKEHVLQSMISLGPKIITENRSDINRIIILGPLLSVNLECVLEMYNLVTFLTYEISFPIETKTMATFYCVALVFPYSATTQISRHYIEIAGIWTFGLVVLACCLFIILWTFLDFNYWKRELYNLKQSCNALKQIVKLRNKKCLLLSYYVRVMTPLLNHYFWHYYILLFYLLYNILLDKGGLKWDVWWIVV